MITFDNVSFRYGTEEQFALKNFSNKICKGELVLLVGASGCGKTTITRLMNGLSPHFYDGQLSGDIQIKGNSTYNTTIQNLADVVGSVFQDPRSQFFATDVTDEIAFSCENAGLSREEMRKRVTVAAERLGISHLLDRSIFALSSGEKQAVAVASVYAFAPEIIVMDEPSANLDPMATQKLREIIQILHKEGFTIVISEHRIHYLLDLVDRVFLIRNGEFITEYSGQEFQRLSNVSANGLGLRSLHLDELSVERAGVKASKSVALEIEQLTVDYIKGHPIIQNMNVQIGVGEILGIVGHNGVGKSTLLETICGLKKERSGRLLFHGKALSPKERIKETYLVMQDSDYQLFTESVENELCLENEDDSAVKTKALNLLREMDLEQFRERHPASLSGGQKQRLSVAVAYMKNASIVCFDEPTSGLDYQNMMRVHKLFRKMADEGKTMIVISHDYEFLLATCERILCIYDNYKTECFELSEQNKVRLTEAMRTR